MFIEERRLDKNLGKKALSIIDENCMYRCKAIGGGKKRRYYAQRKIDVYCRSFWRLALSLTPRRCVELGRAGARALIYLFELIAGEPSAS